MSKAHIHTRDQKVYSSILFVLKNTINSYLRLEINVVWENFSAFDVFFETNLTIIYICTSKSSKTLV